MKKILCLVLSAIMICGMTSCDDHKHSHPNMVGNVDDEKGDVNQEDMPYGSTIYELRPENDSRVKYIMEFDKRYFGWDGENNDLSEIYLIHDYIVAVNENDHETIKNLYYPGYLEQLCKNGGYSSADEYLDDMNNTLKQTLGEDFEIDYVNISNCLTEGEEAEKFFQYADAELALLDSSVLGKITSKKVIEIGGYTCFSAGDNDYLLKNYTTPINLRIYQIDGKYYLF
jgi:hypothetical protein